MEQESLRQCLLHCAGLLKLNTGIRTVCLVSEKVSDGFEQPEGLCFASFATCGQLLALHVSRVFPISSLCAKTIFYLPRVAVKCGEWSGGPRPGPPPRWCEGGAGGFPGREPCPRRTWAVTRGGRRRSRSAFFFFFVFLSFFYFYFFFGLEK